MRVHLLPSSSPRGQAGPAEPPDCTPSADRECVPDGAFLLAGCTCECCVRPARQLAGRRPPPASQTAKPNFRGSPLLRSLTSCTREHCSGPGLTSLRARTPGKPKRSPQNPPSPGADAETAHTPSSCPPQSPVRTRPNQWCRHQLTLRIHPCPAVATGNLLEG